MNASKVKQALTEAKLGCNNWCIKPRGYGECICGAEEHNARIDVHLAEFENIEFVKVGEFEWPMLKGE